MMSCKKNDDDLKNQIANLESRVSSIENNLLEINDNLDLLQEQGKLNTDEVNSLKQVSADLSVITNGIKNSNSVNVSEIANLKASLEKTITSIQFEELKKTLSQLSVLVNNNYLEQKLTKKNTEELQSIIVKFATELEAIGAIETTQEIVGKIEKGAFAKGSLISLYEMDSTLRQTGRSFNSTIEDNLGSFHLKVKNLKGKMVRIVADGFYYNEVSNRNSTSKISLTGIIKIDSSESINVNVLTHLEEPRVKYLISQGKSFNEAKEQAVKEVLHIFGIENSGITRAEKVSLIGSSNTNNILLVLSTMLVGYRSDSELTEILNDIAQDLKSDGTLNNVALGNDIATHLYYLNANNVVNQVKNKYNGVYPDSLLNNINLSYLESFKQLTTYHKSYDLIEYPDTTSTVYNGKNLLGDITSLTSNIFEASAILKSDALKLRVEISADFGDNPTPSSFVLSSLLGTNQNWIVKHSTNVMTSLETTKLGLNTVSLTVQSPTQSVKLNIKYFESSSSTPTKTKTVTLAY